MSSIPNLAGYFTGGNTLTLNQTGNLSQAFAINGTFTVDMDFNFASCHIFMGPNASIVVEAGRKLIFVNRVYIHACGTYMWDGIYLEPGGAVIKGADFFMEDAQNGVVVSRGSNYSFMNSFFNRNWKAIVVEEDEDKVSNTMNCFFGCIDPLFIPGTFTINPVLNPATIQLIPHVNQRGFAGIDINDVTDDVNSLSRYVGLQIGAEAWSNNLGIVNPPNTCTSCLPNTFYNLDFGIHATNSDLLILNNNFRGIDNVNEPIGEGVSLHVQPGTAILSNNTNSTHPNTIFIGTDNQGTFNALYKNTFEDGKRGILLLNNVNGKIKFNTFTRMTGSGIQLRNAINQSLDVQVNTFADCVRGIFLRNTSNLPGNTNQISIENNTYNYSWTFNPGTFPPNSPLPVFAMAHAGTSARAINLSIKNNTLQRAKTGIFINNYGGKSFNLEVSGNTIGLDNDINKSLYGIRATNCRYIQIKQNGIGKTATSTGLTPIGISLESALKNNLYENTLFKMGSGIGAYNSNTSSTLQCNLMDDNETGVYFQNSNLGVQGNPNLPSDNQFVSSNINDILTNISNPIQSTWWTRSLSLPWSTSNQIPFGFPPVIFNLVTISQIPAINCDNPCVGPGCDHQRLLYIVQNDTIFQQLSTEAQYTAKLNAFRIIQDDTSIFNMNLPSDSLFENFYDSMLLVNAGNIQNVEHFIQELDTTEARNYNELIVPENEEEAYLQVVNQIYLNTWARGNFDLDSATISILMDFAYLSPEYFGEAVYLARALLDENLDDYPYEEGSNRIALNKPKNDDEFFIFPNPSVSGIFTIVNKGEILGDCKLEVYSLEGRLIQSQQIPVFDKGIQFDLSNQNASTYFVKIITQEKVVVSTLIKLNE